MSPRYDDAFYAVTQQSRPSAERVTALLKSRLPIASVADFGCARGTWLAAWQRLGVHDVVGVDSLQAQSFEVEPALIRRADLTRPIDLGRRFDLVHSFEVAEHLPADAAPAFVASLARHGGLIVFSASPPGQGGEHHVNERPYAYWRDLFFRHGYAMYDCLRPLLRGDRTVRYWYRYNIFLFADEAAGSALPADWRRCRVAETGDVPDVAPAWFKARKAVVRHIPAQAQTAISRVLSWLRGRTG
jgi:SAM-dependent methyltransferase